MLPTINNKSFLDCNAEDLKVLIENPDYRENEYIDYKKNFSFLEIPKDKKDLLTQKKYEFKSDVCAFANAEGGYLVFGISDDNGCASELCGIDIPNDNTDKFELDRRNDLAGIQPKVPVISFRFIKLDVEKYVVIIYVKHDYFAPYLHIEDEKNYQVFKRTGNKKTTITYTELRNMFNQSLSLDKEIYNYRKERIQYYSEQSEEESDKYSRFLLLHIIPETFSDPSYNKNMFVLYRKKRYDFSYIFRDFTYSSRINPCVDGLRFLPDNDNVSNAECYINNNGIIECFESLSERVLFSKNQFPNGFFANRSYWREISITLDRYRNIFKDIIKDERLFICISIIGCKGLPTQASENGFYIDSPGTIDRNKLICNPLVLNNIHDDNEYAEIVKLLQIEYLQSLGIQDDANLNHLIKDVYG
ncbi:AlbA family DNA-binding domain-containing protein [Ruminococcus flavefaciens]|uniref:Putative DNA-binding domain-containing protein n=1 Tax=Ruminococcus flavefaciens TaxID=1265 RepID=A0A1K1MHD4_RUMFL|nr:ATP-binding protein [Ruminococcus flavefaciens]SFW22546.1 Putative DNA-binding domain-containing protein [Ruminococcus flavefaciens]